MLQAYRRIAALQSPVERARPVARVARPRAVNRPPVRSGALTLSDALARVLVKARARGTSPEDAQRLYAIHDQVLEAHKRSISVWLT